MTDPEFSHPEAPPAGRRGVWITGAIAMIVIVVVILILARRQSRALATETVERAATATEGPLVRVGVVSNAAATRDVIVQGDAEPWATVTLYAKVSGYLKRITVDKGDNVHQGDVIADVESPETDQAWIAAKADADDKKQLAQRDHELLAKKFVALEEVQTADAAVQIAAARLEGLNTERGYEHLVAPFDGTVTARFADPGALVQAATTNQTSALPVVTIADVSHLRVRIYLNQEQAAQARRGTRATITLAERPGVAIAATISRLTEELDPKTRTLLAELDVDNQNHILLAGSFVDVHLTLPVSAHVTVPAAALISRGDKTFVALIDSANRVRFQQVTPGDNDGKTVDIVDGVHPGQRVALNLGRGVTDGTLVRPDSSADGKP
jgi:membrane fusion protein (multidrug efflux system)